MAVAMVRQSLYDAHVYRCLPYVLIAAEIAISMLSLETSQTRENLACANGIQGPSGAATHSTAWSRASEFYCSLEATVSWPRNPLDRHPHPQCQFHHNAGTVIWPPSDDL